MAWHKWFWGECRKMWLDTLAPNGKYGFNRMMAFTSYWTAMPLSVIAFMKMPELRIEILFILFGVATGSKLVNSLDKVTQKHTPDNSAAQ